jgi:hypothetical protein
LEDGLYGLRPIGSTIKSIINIHLGFILCIRSSSSLAFLYLKPSSLFGSTSIRGTLGGLPISRQSLGSLLPQRGPSQERDSGAVGELCRPCARVDHLASRRGPFSSSGRNTNPYARLRTVRASADSTVVGYHRSDWQPDQRQQMRPSNNPPSRSPSSRLLGDFPL